MTDQLLPVLPLRSIVPLPGAMLPVEVGRSASVRAIEAAAEDDNHILLVPQIDPEVEAPEATDLYELGVSGEIVQTINHSPGHVTAIVRLDQRVRVADYVEGMSYLAARIEPFETVESSGPETDKLTKRLTAALEQILQQEGESDHEVLEASEVDDLVSIAVQHLDMERDEMLALLSEADAYKRLMTIVPQLERVVEVVQVGADIREELVEDATVSARESVLRERMRAIKAELGEDGDTDVIEEYREKIHDSAMPDEVRAQAKKELSNMSHMASESPQFNVSQTYLDRLLEVPWGNHTDDTLDVSAARAILDAEHSGLQKVKKRILEFIAVRKLVPDKQGPILCLVGPPGVGKTSLGRSISHALGREYVRVALGGVRDESEIRGHRRTYIGALTGRIATSLVKAGTMNPVFVLDEVDKLGSDHRGDPTSALLEVLDPEQNCEFVDHYLEVPLDLSRVMFLATANQLDTIPGPLLDRMEIIEVPSYTRVEKRTIARDHLLPKQMAEHGLSKAALQVDDETLDRLVSAYTREAGVRNLERELGAVCRSVAVAIASKKLESAHIKAADLDEILGPEKFFDEVAGREPEVGVATGLAWTPVGGVLLFIEVRDMPGKGNLKLTGQVGDVMSESVQTALSWTRANAERLGIDAKVFSTRDLHVHLPAGAIKKDGPSAGVAITTVIVSLLTNRKLRNDVAITGEVTLRGKVLPVGGVKEKILAAHRAGVSTLILPKRNEKDLRDIPANVLDLLEVHLVSKVDEAIEIALSPPAKAGDDLTMPPPGVESSKSDHVDTAVE